MRLSAPHGPAGRSGAPPLRVPAPAAVAAALLVPAVLAALVPGLGTAWQLDRAAVAAGELGRVLTCHWTHWTAEHLLWDGLAAGVLAWLCGVRAPRRAAVALAAAAVAVPVAVLVALPEIVAYRGLSGLDSALYVLVATAMIRDALREGRARAALVPALALAAFVAKTVFELTTRSAVFAETGAFVAVPLAHAAGAMVGFASAFLPEG